MPFDLSPYNVTLGGFDYPVKYSQLLPYIQDGLNNLAGFKNRIINGKMDIAQRGSSLTGVVAGTANAFVADRFRLDQAGHAAALTISQQADVPSGNEFQNSLRFAVTTADTSIASGDVLVVTHPIEGYNVRDLIGRTFTISFWSRSSKTGIHCAAFRNSGTDRSYVAEYTINAANTWEFKTITVSGGLITAGTWNWTNGAGLFVSFGLAVGSTFQTTAGAWQTGNFVGTANQVNCLDTIGNIFAITGVQLEVGSVATPFEHRPYGTELQLAQRYFYPNEISLGNAITTTQADFVFVFKSQMRVAPTMTQKSFGLNLRVIGSTSNINTFSNLISSGTRSATMQLTRTTGTWTAGNAVLLAEEDAFQFSAEL